MPVVSSAYEEDIEKVGELTKLQQVEVVNILEVNAQHVVWGRIEYPVEGYFQIADSNLNVQYAHSVNVHHDIAHDDNHQCELKRQNKEFCSLSADAMRWHIVKDKLGGDKHVGIARLKLKNKKDKGECYLQYAYGASSEAKAQEKVLECCEQSRRGLDLENPEKPTKDCKIVGPAVSDSFESKCNFRLGKKTFMKDECYCPANRPHMLKSGSIVWHSEGLKSSIDINANVICIDDCTARSMNPPHAKTDLNKEDWPVVFLAVYNLPYGIVHSNLAFCPDTSIVQDRSPCYQPNANKSACSTSKHTSAFLEGNEVPRLLYKHGCRELIFDGNGGGGLWTPAEAETGCWAQGLDAQEFWWDGGDDGNYRSGIGYQKLFWLTSENSVRPFADQKTGVRHGGLRPATEQSETGALSLEFRMKKCFSDSLGNRIDFNPGTYSLLHHNCNKFSSEAMRELDLPLFAKKKDKGYHGEIALSATPEESKLRRGFHAIVSYFDRSRSSVSSTCRNIVFEKELNCRRVGWGGRKGDCPVDTYDDEALRCYDPNLRSSEGTGGLSTTVEYDGRVNGVCGVPAGNPCSSGPGSPPCQPGFHCAEVDVTKKEKVGTEGSFIFKTNVYEERTEKKNLCIENDDCTAAVPGASMRESDTRVTGHYCKCPSGTNVVCDHRVYVFGRYFNPRDLNLVDCTCA